MSPVEGENQKLLRVEFSIVLPIEQRLMAFSPRAGLTLEEVRQRNIARNNDFLKNLFGPSEEETASVVAPVAQSTEDAELIPVESIRARDKLMLALKEEVKKSFQGREAETEQIFGYLSDVSAILSASMILQYQHTPTCTLFLVNF